MYVACHLLAIISREKLEAKWSRAAKRAGAREVYIVNEVDDEEIPSLPAKFKYREVGYQ